MPSVLFVCTGNIHRSPMAEAIFKAKMADSQDSWNIESVGTWAPIGQPASREVHYVMKKVGIDVSGHRSRLVERSTLSNFKLILTMEANHKEALQAEFPGMANQIFMLSEMVGMQQDVEDPIGGTLVDFLETAREIDQYLTDGLTQICELAK